MTVGQLYDNLGKLVKDGHSETRVIANCDCTLDGIHREFPLLHLCSVYYQSGDIELGFTDVEEEKSEELSNVLAWKEIEIPRGIMNEKETD